MQFSKCRGALIVGFSLVSVAGAPRLSGQSVLRGVLYDDATGARLRGTVMLVDPATDAPLVHTITDTLGQFTIQFRGGTFQVAAVHPGYTSVLSAPMSFANGERMTIRIPIAADGDPIHSIGVLEHVLPADAKPAAARERSAMDGFEARRTLGTGLHYDHAELVRSRRRSVGDFLQTVPGLRAADPTSTRSLIVSRSQAQVAANGMAGSSCRIAWFLDGHRIDVPGRNDSMTEGLGAMSLENVAGLEVFRGLSEIPPEFAEPDVRCGAIALWTQVG